MTAQRSKAEVDRMYRVACATRQTLSGLATGGAGTWTTFDALRALDYAITEYHRPITLERTFNALRDAVKQAEAEILKYHRDKTEERS